MKLPSWACAAVLSQVIIAVAVSGAAYAENDPAAVPSVVIIGTSKGGTTDVFHQIIELFSSKVIVPMHKEPGTMVYGNDEGLWSSGAHQGLSNYMRKLHHPCAGDFAEGMTLASCVNHDLTGMTMDATPFYMDHPLVADLLKSFSPNSKIILLLREPVERAISFYNHKKVQPRHGLLHDNRTVEDLAVEFLAWTESPAVKRLFDKLLETSDHDKQLEYYMDLLKEGWMDGPANSIFSTGMYYYPLLHWKKVLFQPSRTLIVDSVSYFTDRAGVMNTVKEFIFNSRFTAQERAASDSLEVRNAKRLKGRFFPGSEMSTAMRQRLDEFYRPHDDRLFELIQEFKNEKFWTIGFPTNHWVEIESS